MRQTDITHVRKLVESGRDSSYRCKDFESSTCSDGGKLENLEKPDFNCGQSGMIRHREAFEEFAEEAEEEPGGSLKHIYLYGSDARGEENEYPDVDVFAVVGSDEQKKRVQGQALEIRVENSVPMSPVMTEEYRNTGDTSFVKKVRVEGVMRRNREETVYEPCTSVKRGKDESIEENEKPVEKLIDLSREER